MKYIIIIKCIGFYTKIHRFYNKTCAFSLRNRIYQNSIDISNFTENEHDIL